MPTCFAAMLLPLIATSSPAQAGLTCTQRCNAALDAQSYGVGASDSVCMGHCEGKLGECEREWQDFFDCADAGQGDGANCSESLALARDCSICDYGLVWEEGADHVLFANPDPSSNCDDACSASQDCSVDIPFCTLKAALGHARDLQEDGDDVKLMVCEGTYRESIHMGATPANPLGSVIVEAATHRMAVVSGSVDHTSAFTVEAQRRIDETEWNHLSWSTDFASGAWGVYGVTPDATAPAPPVACSDLQHAGFSCTGVGAATAYTTTDSTSTSVLFQDNLGLSGVQPTFSIYVRPGTVPSLRLDMLVTGDDNPHVDLPLTGDPACNGVTHSHNAWAGVEAVGQTGWMRVWLTARLEYGATVDAVRIWLDHADHTHITEAGYTIELFGPQLDSRPYDEYESDARTYYPTLGVPISAVKSRWLDVHEAAVVDKAWGLQPTIDSADVYPLGRRAEMVFVDDVPLRQVLANNDLVPGTFRVVDDIDLSTNDYANFATKPFVHPPDVDNGHIPNSCSAAAPCALEFVLPAGHGTIERIEVSDKRALMHILTPYHWDVRGLTFQHASGAWDGVSPEGIPPAMAPHSNVAAVVYDAAEDFTLTENLHQHNGGYGLSVLKGAYGGHNVVLWHNTHADNGAAGAFIGGLRGGLVQGEQWLRNNWRGTMGRFSGAVTTGAKVGGTVDTDFVEVLAADNAAHGLWFDYDNRGVRIEASTFSTNASAGLYLERNDIQPGDYDHLPHEPEPDWDSDVTLLVWNNLFDSNAVGLEGVTSGPVNVGSNTFTGNRTALGFIGDSNDANEAPVHDWTVEGNAFEATCSQDLFVDYGADLLDFDAFGATLTVSESVYIHPLGPAAEAFRISRPGATPDTEYLDYAEWAQCDAYLVPPSTCIFESLSSWK
ncbi:MAG: right-handed parallel beta-helix repeat-containing protein [Myxococcales bacterium]|nr:right-handed parallel beta-helix repeat-containing protein [Myxococcales bacterium]